MPLQRDDPFVEIPATSDIGATLQRIEERLAEVLKVVTEGLRRIERRRGF